MKVIDEKGKLFGRINIVDLLALVLIAAVAVALGVKFLGGEPAQAQTQTLTYTARVRGVDQATYENVRQFVNKEAGLKEQLMASGSLLPGYIVDVTASEHVYGADEADTGALDLLFTVEVQVPVGDVKNEVGTQEVRIGKGHILKGEHLEFGNAIIMTCQWSG